MPEVGDQPMPRERDERFAKLVAEGATYLSAWCESADGDLKPAPTASARVQASRKAKHCADRIVHLKTQRAVAVASNDTSDPLTAASLTGIMQETTETLVRAANAAQRAGSEALAQNLRRVVVTHSGRAHRVENRSPKLTNESPAIPVADYLARLRLCECP